MSKIIGVYFILQCDMFEAMMNKLKHFFFLALDYLVVLASINVIFTLSNFWSSQGIEQYDF
jgi:hypothetical protein